MKTFIVSLAIATFLPAAAAFASGTGEAMLKCSRGGVGIRSVLPAPVVHVGGDATRPPARLALPGAVSSPPPVYVVDARIVERADFEATDREVIESIIIVCSDDRHRVFGVEPGRDLVLVFTEPGRYTALKASVESIVSLQAAYLVNNGSFASNLADLSWNDPSGSVTVTLTVSEDGSRWSATGTHRHLADGIAVAVSGERTPAAGGRNE